MAAKLKIHFDGEVPGVPDHKLDLVAFGEALAALTNGLKRTASGLVSKAVETKAFGRLAKGAELHVFLEELTKGSLGLNLEIESVPGPGYTPDLIEGLPVRAVKQFVVALQDESKGALRDTLARRFLKSLPLGITAQRYEVYDGDNRVLDVNIGEVKLAQEPQDLPTVAKFMAHISGVTFGPAPEVRLESIGGGGRVTYSATEKMIDIAIRLRDEEVLVLAVIAGGKNRLLWIDRPDEFPTPLSKDQRADMILGQWDRTLERLSK